MILVIAYIINLLAPIVNTIGAFGLIGCIVYDEPEMLIYGGIVAVVGFIFGMVAYNNDIPPRWFWAKSKNQIFSFSVTAVLGYTWSFAAWVFAVYMVQLIIERM